MINYESARALILQMLKTRMAFRQALQRVLKRNNIDMTFEMLQIMNCLWHQEGVSQQILAQKTAKDKACLTNLMTNLEKKNWVIRQEDPADRRNRLVYLTPQGRAINDRVRPMIKELYSQTGVQMGIEELNMCVNQLQRVDEILNRL
ncbi:MAG: MarR family transcriptional regulator [Mucinivorans sp.]